MRKYNGIATMNDMRIYFDVEAKNLQDAFFTARERFEFHLMKNAVIEHLAIENNSGRN